MILRLLTETSWGLTLGVEGGLVVQAPSTNPPPLKDKSLRHSCAHNPGIRMELGKLSLLRHIPLSTDRSSTAQRFPKPQVAGSNPASPSSFFFVFQQVECPGKLAWSAPKHRLQ